jgi:hypothetical protein
VKHISNEKEFLDDKKIENDYYKEIEELLKQQTGAKRVFIFDHTIRRPTKEGYVPSRRTPVVSVIRV